MLWAAEGSWEWRQVANGGGGGCQGTGATVPPGAAPGGCALGGSGAVGTPLAQTLLGLRCYRQTRGCKGEASVREVECFHAAQLRVFQALISRVVGLAEGPGGVAQGLGRWVKPRQVKQQGEGKRVHRHGT